MISVYLLLDFYFPKFYRTVLFAIFYPNDGHEPLLCLIDPEKIKKAVANIKM